MGPGWRRWGGSQVSAVAGQFVGCAPVFWLDPGEPCVFVGRGPSSSVGRRPSVAPEPEKALRYGKVGARTPRARTADALVRRAPDRQEGAAKERETSAFATAQQLVRPPRPRPQAPDRQKSPAKTPRINGIAAVRKLSRQPGLRPPSARSAKDRSQQRRPTTRAVGLGSGRRRNHGGDGRTERQPTTFRANSPCR